ncbi:phage/plasmid primase, P4 family [Pseudomonas aeruginosa]|uniref:phage/plasmid primase, P4 family n=2 Tax=Gammaproteobacteria TaxID=1236 RepID=UPI00204471EA|nr:phage/plasmid primase, P4 family [Pseudomonas aeruginosa]MCM3889423.1 phage/plasmid primase, P4 family [Pseudomonas aeruginosa]MCM3940160.1 phage/plasmid primase, P4 family [Pseudomonas aeruginosa]MCM3951036.1 phage/plasmid primase, P4 family [Pseudomonas aeruginosa]MCM3958285.1 phage/plasmid primase, P4 family [Pseudomonas aeruginosa]MCM3964403.1 phage/plasmid primase, P4 family [Pseudomonas aeruginosa]
MLDFNDSPPPVPEHNRDAERETLRLDLLARIEPVLATLFPAGKKRRGKFLIGDVLGSPGDSLEVVLDGDKAGLWTDRATGDGGDIFDLIACHLALSIHTDFNRVLDAAADLLGRARSAPVRKGKKQAAPVDDLGPATAKWDYLDASGKLIAVVYRYDPPGGKKQFRPWDAKRHKMAPPDPRPLYNQPGMASSAQVVLVEGEKCAQALIDFGVNATTAMHGANAPVDKTNWSPLSGKAVLIWPDRDKPGWEYAAQAAQAVLAAGAKSCHILYPPEDAPEGWDAADAIAEGFDVATFLTHGPRMQMHDLADVDEPVVGSDESVWGTEDALALAFTRRYHRDWRYVAAWGRWLVWDGQRWRTEDTLAATDLIRSVCRQAAVRAESPKVAAKLASSGTVSGVERLARADRRHAATTDEWDADPWLLNTPGGVVDLRTGRQRPHERVDRMTKITTATPKGECPQWTSFLSDITGGDADLQSYLQRMVGYCLTGVTSAHALFFLYGTGANGKSVFANVVATILGDYASTAPMDTFVETRGDRHPTDLAGLRGARFVSAIETEQGRRWNESKVKAITGGDKISARFMRQDFFEYTPQFKPVIVGNHKPAIRNIDEAMRRRMHLIPFTVTIPPEKRDGRLTEKLLAERDGILAWAVTGCLAWQREGLNPPVCVQAATDEYFEAEDAVGQWIDERCLLANTHREGVSELFSDWREWAERAGEYVGSVKRFSELMTTRKFEKCRLTGGARGIAGIALRPKPYGHSYPYRDD